MSSTVSKLLTYDEYHQLGEHQSPYSFILEKDAQYLYYFGSKHFFDPENEEQISLLKKFWYKFVSQTEGKNRVVFVEGAINRDLRDEGNAITKAGESGLTTFLAQQEHIEVLSPEPGRTKEMEALEKVFPREQIIYYYVARIIAQWHNLTLKPPIEECLHIILKEFDFSLEQIKEVHERIYATKFDPTDGEFFKKICRPGITTTIINKIAQDVGYIRNRYIIQRIEEEIEIGKSIFITFGSSHAVMQERALKEILA